MTFEGIIVVLLRSFIIYQFEHIVPVYISVPTAGTLISLSSVHDDGDTRESGRQDSRHIHVFHGSHDEWGVSKFDIIFSCSA
jgi:hypothetical protein